MASDIRIGIHGSRSSGKSCYLASLYGKQTDGDISLLLPDNDTIELLENLWQQIESGKRLPANPLAKVKQVPFSLNNNGEVSRIITVDYSGELVQRPRKHAESSNNYSGHRLPDGTQQFPEPAIDEENANQERSAQPEISNADTAQQELAEDVRRWMHNSDAICIIIDAEDLDQSSPEELRERQVEVGLLITALQNGKRLTKPLALVVTKWDLVSSKLSTQAEETQRLRDFIEDHGLLSQISKGVELSGNDFHVFPVSAFGGNVDRKYPPPKDKLSPFNTLTPLAWCVERVRKLRQSAQFRKLRLALLVIAALVLLFNISVLGYEDHLKHRMISATERKLRIDVIATRTARYEDWRADWQPWRRRLHLSSVPLVVLLALGYLYCSKKEKT